MDRFTQQTPKEGDANSNLEYKKLDEQVKEARFAIEKDRSHMIVVKKGEVKQPNGLVKFFNNKIFAGIGVGTALVTGLVIVNEATGFIRISSKTPLTLVRRLISKDKP